MKTSFKVISGILAALILSAGVAYVLVSVDIKAVDGFCVTNRTETSQTFEWKASDVSGYKIYQKNAKGKQYRMIKKISDPKVNKFTLNSLDMETFYTFKISCYVDFLGFSTESDMSNPITTCTVPKGENISEITSKGEDTLNVSWTTNSSPKGYEIMYSSTDDFKNAKSFEISKKNTSTCELSGLENNQMYYFKIRTYLILDGEKIYSDYSKVGSGVLGSKVDISQYDLSKPMIALTFDDGPDYENVSNSILNVLKKYNSKATFFQVGDRVLANPKNIKKKVDMGCELGNHTYDHNHYGNSVTASDIKKCSQAIYKITGKYPTAFRSTGGETTATIKKECRAEGMPLYYWSIDTEDWKSRNADSVYNNIMKAKDGSIILMHDIYQSTADAVKRAVPQLVKKGYQLVTVSELVLARTGAKAKAGVEYINAKEVLNR